jgi:two-component system, OmpR family, phosphate regulon response regulator OmpR
MSGHVLLVEDEPSVGELVRSYLARDGWIVIWVRSGEEAIAELDRHSIRIVILDIGLPGMDGFAVCQEMRSRSRVPILMLTARDEEADRVVGLEVGADDYLPKPFNPRELLARIHAVLRRRPAMEAPGAPALDAQTVTFGPFVFDLALRRLTKDGEQIALTTGEFSMLKALVRHPRQPLSRDKLAQLARGREFEPFDRSLDVQISRLRKMIEPDPTQPRYIQTVWGVGYVFVPDGAA